MQITYDPEKRALTLKHRGLDFAHAGLIFAGRTMTVEDDRQDYGEVRYQTIGRLKRFIVMVVWTERGEARRIISMRKCDAEERQNYRDYLDRPG